jgi:short-subunit dehydrogenase
MKAHRNFTAAAGIALGMVASMLVQRRRTMSLRDKTVFVTGGSRGLGLLLAQEFASGGARIAISARDRRELERAETQLRMITDQVLTLEADMTCAKRWTWRFRKSNNISVSWMFL